jgi:hypothetical protein
VEQGYRGLLRAYRVVQLSGDCETHCVTIMIHRGAWVFAEQETHRACAKVQCIDMVQSRHGLRRHRRDPVADG